MTSPSDAGAGTPRAGNRDRDPTLGELVGQLSGHLSTLVRQEIDLAKVELKHEAAAAGRATGALGAAAFAGAMTLVFASCALWWGLANVMDAGWAALVVAASWTAVAVPLYLAGRRRLRTVHPEPRRTVETLSDLPHAFRRREDRR